MPIRIYQNKQKIWLEPNTEWNKHKVSKNAIIEIDPNFYIQESKISKNKNSEEMEGL